MYWCIVVATPKLYVFVVFNNIFGRSELTTNEPLTCNIDVHVVMFASTTTPHTFNNDKHAVVFDNVVLPETFNKDKHVVGVLKIYIIWTINNYTRYTCTWLW